MYRSAFATIVLLFLAGCGDSGPKTYPVTGKISIGGNPPSGVSVTFHPVTEGNEAASGQVNDQGNYTLYTGIDGKQGAMPGRYKVVLTQVAGASAATYEQGGGAARGGIPGTPPRTFPDDWGSAQTSPKEVEVKTETNQIDIEVPARS
jgi:hypothetical protein